MRATNRREEYVIQQQVSTALQGRNNLCRSVVNAMEEQTASAAVNWLDGHNPDDLHKLSAGALSEALSFFPAPPNSPTRWTFFARKSHSRSASQCKTADLSNITPDCPSIDFQLRRNLLSIQSSRLPFVRRCGSSTALPLLGGQLPPLPITYRPTVGILTSASQPPKKARVLLDPTSGKIYNAGAPYGYRPRCNNTSSQRGR